MTLVMRLNYQLRKWIMEKVEQYIKEHTRNCSNEIIIPTQDGCSYTKGYTSWLTPDHARKVAEIARKETIKEVCEWLDNNVTGFCVINDTYDVDGCIEDLKKAFERTP